MVTAGYIKLCSHNILINFCAEPITLFNLQNALMDSLNVAVEGVLSNQEFVMERSIVRMKVMRLGVQVSDISALKIQLMRLGVHVSDISALNIKCLFSF